MGGTKRGVNVESLAVGAAAVLPGPTVLNAAGGILRSLVKAGIKGGLVLYGSGKEAAAAAKERVETLAAEAKESMEDLAAEARAGVSGGTAPKKEKPGAAGRGSRRTTARRSRKKKEGEAAQKRM